MHGRRRTGHGTWIFPTFAPARPPRPACPPSSESLLWDPLTSSDSGKGGREGQCGGGKRGDEANAGLGRVEGLRDPRFRPPTRLGPPSRTGGAASGSGDPAALARPWRAPRTGRSPRRGNEGGNEGGVRLRPASVDFSLLSLSASSAPPDPPCGRRIFVPPLAERWASDKPLARSAFGTDSVPGVVAAQRRRGKVRRHFDHAPSHPISPYPAPSSNPPPWIPPTLCGSETEGV